MTDEEIWHQVEQFRSEHRPHLEANQIPLDLLTFAELELRLDLIPYEGLRDHFSADAAILSDFSGFYIDQHLFDRIDILSHSQFNRLRFSLAHELGHLILHRSLFESEQITNRESLLEWLNDHAGEKYRIEREANEFAGRLLVPIDILRPLFEQLATGYDTIHGVHGWQNKQELRQKTCELISPKFGLHPLGISARLDREGLWQSIY